MALYNVYGEPLNMKMEFGRGTMFMGDPVQDSSPLFVYSPPGAWIDTPLEINDPLSLSYHATDVQNATVELDFIGTGVRVFSATPPAPGSYKVYVDGQSLSDLVDQSSQPDSQLLLESITGLEMGPHTVTLVNSGVTGDFLDLARVEVESVVTNGGSLLSTATFDDAVDEIQWGSGWISAIGGPNFYNTTVHYTEQPDAQMSFSFEGDAIAIYGTSGMEMGYYVVTLDGRSETLNGGSDGSVRLNHDKTILYLSNGLSPGRHELTIIANPSSLGYPQVFNVDCIRVLSGSSSDGPVLLPPGPPNTGTSSTLQPPASTGLSYTSVISSTVFSMPTPLPTSTLSTLPTSSMPSSSTTSPVLLPTANFDNSQSNTGLRAASNSSGFKVVTDKWVVSSAILSGAIVGIGLIFFALFMWKRKTLDPPSYIDLEKANRPDEKGRMMEPGEKSPELPIQPVGKIIPEEDDNPFADSPPYARYPPREPFTEWKPGHSRNGSNVSSVTANECAYDSYWETLQKRAQLTSSVVSTDSTYQGSIPEHALKGHGHTGSGIRGTVGSISSVHSSASNYSQTSEIISINNVRMPPQFSTPTRPPSVASLPRSKRVSPPRPPRVRESLALPF
ncbi:hypothetical protein BJ322DRAFT_1103652 [Thelephora terrestris]|uniref:Transmembrane protein n=1 Tax=Thelephora terrestris TaxID=56493 RepID=A0A9P6LDX3_9AGAM|nr:hypothetical protein BJ322DRAFT_1103652 [Thelephora terrestris]